MVLFTAAVGNISEELGFLRGHQEGKGMWKLNSGTTLAAGCMHTPRGRGGEKSDPHQDQGWALMVSEI